MAEDIQVLVVPHTHWDREWYQTFQQFRMRLVRAVDHVLDVLERDARFRYFMLDGQMILLEDYLAIRPENEERLRALTRVGRLLVGPWYLQPDEFLVGGESLIRNLQLGRRMAEAYGGAMRVGYVPDTFGHIAQLPQLLRGFGLDNAVIWRGIPPEIERSEFRWAAPDGSEVLAVWLCHETGYANAAQLPRDTDSLVARIGLITAVLGSRATSSALLLMNGSDHLEPQDGLPAALDDANVRLRAHGLHAFIGTLPQYLAIIREGRQPLQVHTGELRSSYHAHLLPGVYSTRVWLKQRNASCEALLTRWAEPASCWAWALGREHPTALLGLAWKELMHNHPHDSICGCGIDQVHREMLPRFDQSQQIADELTNEALRFLARQVDTRAIMRSVPLVVFNPTGHARSDLVSCELELPATYVDVVDERGSAVPFEQRCVAPVELLRQDVDKDMVVSLLGIANDGRALGYIISDVRVARTAEPGVATITVTVSEQGDPDPGIIEQAKADVQEMAARDDITTFRAIAYQAPRTELTLLARDVPPCGGRTLFVRPAASGAPPAVGEPGDGDGVRTGPLTIENEHLTVRVDPATGTFSLADKLRGVTYHGLNRFIDSGDVGDLYTYCPPLSDWEISAPCRPPHVEAVQATALRGTLRVSRSYQVPAACTPDRRARGGETVECHVVSEITLVAGARRVEVRSSVTNTARDHRLRVLFPVPFAADEAEAEGVFEVTRRPARQPIPADGSWAHWSELPTDTQPHKRFVAVGEGQCGLAVLNRGIAEYEIVSGVEDGASAIALTLLRCVGWLSRSDLATRHGHAGPMLPTPEAQGEGRHVFEYALVPHGGTWHADNACVLGEAEAFEAPLRACAAEHHDGPLASAWSFVRVAPAVLAVSAVKRAERRDGVIVRLYNPGVHVVTGEVSLALPHRAVTCVDLNEDDLPEAPVDVTELPGGTVRLTLRGGQIRTLLFRLA